LNVISSTQVQNVQKQFWLNWDKSRARFVKVFPTEYKRALGELWEKSQGNKQAASV